MGLLNGLFKKNAITLSAHAAGRCIGIREVEDSVFGQEILGQGIAIEPAEGKFYSPVDGTVTTVFGTCHAVGITSVEGVELMVHVGIDTVELKGEHFAMKVAENQRVKKEICCWRRI